MKEQNNSTWTIDPGHSSIQFKVKHLGIANIVGTFNKFQGQIVCKTDDFANADVTFTLDADSLSTNNKQRDEHLQGEIFFDVMHFPTITFTGLLKKTGTGYVVDGDLTIRGITKSIQLTAELTGIGTGRLDDTRAGFEMNGKINRKDFGITLEILTGTGSLVVGENVNLFIEVELIKQQGEVPA